MLNINVVYFLPFYLESINKKYASFDKIFKKMNINIRTITIQAKVIFFNELS